MVSAFPAGSTRKVLAPPPTAHGHTCSKAKQISGLSPPGAGNAFDRVSAPTPPWQMGNSEMRFISAVCSSCGLMVEASETGRASAPGCPQWFRPPALY